MSAVAAYFDTSVNLETDQGAERLQVRDADRNR